MSGKGEFGRRKAVRELDKLEKAARGKVALASGKLGGKEMKAARFFGRRRASTLVFMLALAGATLAALGHVAVQAKTVEVALLLSEARDEHERLLAEKRRLELLVSELKDPGRLMAEGRKRGMSPTAAAIRPIAPPAEVKP